VLLILFVHFIAGTLHILESYPRSVFGHFLTETALPSSWMLRRAAHVRTDVSENRIASILSMSRIGELGTM
jgi:hypothetical protein